MMNIVKSRVLFYWIAICFILVAACSGVTQPENPQPQSTPIENPAWVSHLIEQYKSEPVGNPPQSIWRYEYRGQVVYFVPAQCCDMYSTLYDADGNVMCAPDGGIDGRGDGKCDDFLSGRSQEQLIWQDPRQP
jgi:hypothetical protein